MVRIILRLSAFFLLSIFCCQIAIGQNREEVKTNEIFLRESIQDLLKQAFTDFPKGYPKLVFIRSESGNSANWLLEEELTSYLTSREFSVAFQQQEYKSEKSENSWDLFYRIIALRLEYPRVKRRGLFGKKFITRETNLNFSFRLTEKNTGEILWTQRKNHTTSDIIPKKATAILDSQQYPFLSPELPESSISKYVEPALVAAVVGGLVYLFFASR